MLECKQWFLLNVALIYQTKFPNLASTTLGRNQMSCIIWNLTRCNMNSIENEYMESSQLAIKAFCVEIKGLLLCFCNFIN